MMRRTRIFYPGIITHCYQMTLDGALLFYTASDCLVFFSILCLMAVKHRIRIYKLCLMADHYHIILTAESQHDLSAFIQAFTSRFVFEQNKETRRTGSLFLGPFGAAVKRKEKDARSALIYVDNNPVERFLTDRAEKYRWNFIAFATSDHPFSEKLVRSRASRPLQQVLSLVDSLQQSGRPVTYPLLKRYFPKLSIKESNQLVDYIISKYSVIDHDAAIRFFGDYERMLQADHSTTGSEHDLKETFVGRDDKSYRVISRFLQESLKMEDIHKVLAFEDKERLDLLVRIVSSTNVPEAQAAKYLRLPFRRVQ